LAVALVSVVVPTRNSERTIERCLESIAGQTHPEVELVVVDNGSSDRTLPVADRFADIVTGGGPERSAQRNRGAALSGGAFLLFIDSDMELPPDVIADCLGRAAATGAPAVVIPERSFGTGFWADCRELERSCYEGDELVEAARFFRREVFEGTGGYDEDLTGAEDWDLSRRVAAGERLPRTSAEILHNEGRLTLAGVFGKRLYYSTGYWRYLNKHRRAALRQANVVVRPAFVANWKRLARRPMLAAGILCLKTVEVAAMLAGVVKLATANGRRHNQSDPR
jgi:glycosyltransferase involved in cell wall biosynthesis